MGEGRVRVTYASLLNGLRDRLFAWVNKFRRQGIFSSHLCFLLMAISFDLDFPLQRSAMVFHFLHIHKSHRPVHLRVACAPTGVVFLHPAHRICGPASVKGVISTLHHVTIIGHQDRVLDWCDLEKWVNRVIRMLGLPPP